MQVSLQRLGDNPRDHDGHFQGLDPKIADVSGVRPDADISAYISPDSEGKLPRSPYKPWRIYPKPPPPHWHWIADTEPVHGSDEAEAGKEEFVFRKCEIPGSHHGWSFGLDEMGVYQVYNTDGSSRVPSVFCDRDVNYCIQEAIGSQSLKSQPSKSISWTSSLFLA